MTDKLSNRMLVNVLGIPGILAVIYFGGYLFGMFITVVMVIALYEFYSLLRIKEVKPLIWLGEIATLLIATYYFFIPTLSPMEVITLIIGLIMLGLLSELFRKVPNPTMNLSVTFMGILYIPFLLGTLIALRNWDSAHGTNLTFSTFLSIWICDTAAYFAGKKFGKKKIYPHVSPNKTVVGSVAGVFGALITVYILNMIGFIGINLNWTNIVIFTVIIGFFGQTGDFVESLFKRDMGVKDSGKMLKGHGGVLDRFDSLIFASPLVLIFVNQVL
jgi:phosphatidate cytidylyltransferase